MNKNREKIRQKIKELEIKKAEIDLEIMRAELELGQTNTKIGFNVYD